MTETFCFHWTGRACGINNKYLTRSYVLTPEYRQFLDSVSLTCRAANPGVKLLGNISLSIQMTIDRARDSDSLIKPIFDGIERSGVIDNDNQIKSYRVDVSAKKRGAADEIFVKGEGPRQ